MENSRSIVNIINFIRAFEPRDASIDLVEPVVNQMRLAKQYHLPVTWLLQYDALMDNRFLPILEQGKEEHHEVGCWFEFVQALIEKAGIKWRGRYAWDWHSHVGFAVGYTPAEREKIVDVYMADFKARLGYYPKSVGSWVLDAHTLGYMADRYGVVAACNCKDQWGTDGYTLWGGYYNQAYYPSRVNSFMPAQNPSNQIPMAMFRMLGSDPIYQYDVRSTDNGQHVVTLEPVYKDGGGNPEWIRWFFDVNYRSPYLAFGYTQVGQENPFGWPAMKDGLTYQMELVAELVARKEITVQTLAESGEWFRQTFKTTPATAMTALTDWKYEGHKSVWYNSRFYRVNLFWENDQFWIRDIHKFDERYTERYIKDVCTGAHSIYDTLPIFDGYLWSKPDQQARMSLVEIRPDGTRHSIKGKNVRVQEQGENLIVEWESESGCVKIACTPNTLEVEFSSSNTCGIEMKWAKDVMVPITQVTDQVIQYRYEEFDYQMECEAGKISRTSEGTILLVAAQSKLRLKIE